MDKEKVLAEIFNDDPMGLLSITPRKSYSHSEDERLLSSFFEINEYITNNGREPQPNLSNISEYQLYSRLKGLRDNLENVAKLKPHDIHNLLPDVVTHHTKERQTKIKESQKINSIDDIFSGDSMGILDIDDAGIFDIKNIPKEERAEADFVARRKPCKDFKKYEKIFKEVQKDLKSGKRKLKKFVQNNLKENAFYIHNGVLFYLEKIDITQKEHYQDDGKRIREDGRTRCIFENGTESNMLKRSVEKILYANGMVVTENVDKVNKDFLKSFNNITNEDEEVGNIYILKSKSSDKKIATIPNLYKIGYSKVSVEERTQNAENDPTYLMAPVQIVETWKCYNLNPGHLEQLLHNFFGNSCLEIDVYDSKGKRHTPREWFIAPLEVIEEAIELIINGKIVNYKYDKEDRTIASRNENLI